jgi:hypothetical protein
MTSDSDGQGHREVSAAKPQPRIYIAPAEQAPSSDAKTAIKQSHAAAST